MRKYVTGVVSTLVALTGFAVYGQTPFQSLRVHIPEAVRVAQSELPAGDYTVRYLNVGGDVPYLMFAPVKGNAIAVAAMRNQLGNGLAADRSELTFDRSNGNLSLSKVQVMGLNYSYDIIGSRTPITPTITR
jgi:hypothetical protein